MRFHSTRGTAQGTTLEQAVVRGIAADGGLYVPDELPSLAPDATSVVLSEVAREVLSPFYAGDTLAPHLDAIVGEALSFPAPLASVADGLDVLELFHGPTAAFKDFGARTLAATLARLQPPVAAPVTILVATSGDTGGAVAAAFHRRAGFEVVVLYPLGQVSPLQEQQLVCWGDNVRTLAVRGTFDDCQRMVKEAFAAAKLAQRHRFSSANSINIGRLLPQLVYYAAASRAVKQRTGGAACFIVPSGNLGNAVACVWARAMGLPIEEIVLAHNANRAVPDFLASGQWQARPSVATPASAMDVGDPSNLERLRHLFPGMESLRAAVSAVSVDDEAIRTRIRVDFERYGRIWCPHTAVAAEAHARLPDARRAARQWVLVATAHPAKFNEVVGPAIGRAVPLPPSLAALMQLPRRVTTIDATLDSFAQALQDRTTAPCSTH